MNSGKWKGSLYILTDQDLNTQQNIHQQLFEWILQQFLLFQDTLIYTANIFSPALGFSLRVSESILCPRHYLMIFLKLTLCFSNLKPLCCGRLLMGLFKARRVANICVQNNGIMLSDCSLQLATFVRLASAWPIKTPPMDIAVLASLCNTILELSA